MFVKPEVCVIPVAGLSTRNLPTTKVLHKGFLTLNNLPIIQYAVDACAEIGVKEIVFVYSDQSCRHLFENYYKKNEWLENHLKEKGKLDLLEAVQKIIPEGMKFSFVEQSEPRGNGHAVLMAKDIIGKRDFIVMWADDVYINTHGGKGVLRQLLDEQVIGESAVWVELGLGGEVFVLCLVNHGVGHFDEMDQGGELDGSQVVEAGDVHKHRAMLALLSAHRPDGAAKKKDENRLLHAFGETGECRVFLVNRGQEMFLRFIEQPYPFTLMPGIEEPVGSAIIRWRLELHYEVGREE